MTAETLITFLADIVFGNMNMALLMFLNLFCFEMKLAKGLSAIREIKGN